MVNMKSYVTSIMLPFLKATRTRMEATESAIGFKLDEVNAIGQACTEKTAEMEAEKMALIESVKEYKTLIEEQDKKIEELVTIVESLQNQISTLSI